MPLLVRAPAEAEYRPLLASMAMTENAIKNTFIHFSNEAADAAPRRPSSLPPCARFSSTGSNTDAKDCTDSFSEVDISTNCTDEDDALSVTTGSEHGFPSEAEAEAIGIANQAAVEIVAPRPSETRLRSSAKAWNAEVPTRLPRRTRKFAEQIENILTVAQTTIITCAWIQSLEIKYEGVAGWSVVARLLPQDLQHKDDVLRLAKAALMQAAGSATKVCMLGCCAKPFATMPLGFAVRFAGVPDGQKACWNLLQNGLCNYGSRCRWEHPVYQRTVYVKVMLPESP